MKKSNIEGTSGGCDYILKGSDFCFILLALKIYGTFMKGSPMEIASKVSHAKTIENFQHVRESSRVEQREEDL